MATMNISLPDTLKDWAESRADTGEYSNTSDYVRDLIRRDRMRAEKIKAMQALISEGFESGVSPMTAEDARARARKEAGLDGGL